MRLKAEILKDYDLSPPPTATTTTRNKKNESISDSQHQQQLKDMWGIHVETEAVGVYEISIDHRFDCRCCTPILKESVTCPTKEERLIPRSRGRPPLKR